MREGGREGGSEGGRGVGEGSQGGAWGSEKRKVGEWERGEGERGVV